MAKPTLKSSVTTINLNTSHPNTPPPYPLGSFAALYIVGILSVVVARYLEPLSLILAYPVISTIISRYVNARVIWWDQSNSIEEIFKAKLYFWILCVKLHAELTRDLHRELTHQRVMFGGQAWVKA